MIKRTNKTSQVINMSTYNKRVLECASCQKDLHQCKKERHHITYNGKKSWTVNVCLSCHYQVTALNTLVAHYLGFELSNEMRVKIWHYFVKYKLGKVMSALKNELNFIITRKH